jgi:DNA-binding transcriptional ArsR family regulator
MTGYLSLQGVYQWTATPVILRRWWEFVRKMEARLWYVLTGTRGGVNRIRILRTVDDQPRNANQVAEELDLHYKTVQHHLDVLTENDILESSGDEYGAIYLPTSQARNHWDLVEEIIEQVD